MMPQDQLEVDLMRAEEAAQALGVSRATLSNWRRRGIGPAFIAFPRGARYRRADLMAWLDEQTKNRRGEGDGSAAGR
jgi:predicted site-specific integrase-resolvase